MKPKVLIIDDEQEIRELFKSFLEEEDVKISEAANGQEAFNLVSNEQFDLYVTDIFMPEMNGVEFLKILKMLDPDAVVIIITGFDNMEYTRQALNYGAFRFLTKPVKMVDFISVVKLGLQERKKLFHTSTAEKLRRMKEKVNTNIELREKLFDKLKTFLLLMEDKNLNYLEIGGPGSKGRIWAKVFSAFKPISMKLSFSQDEINIMILSILSEHQFEALIADKTIRANFEFEDDNVRYRYRLIMYFEMDELVIGIKMTRRKLINIESMRFTSNVINKITFKNENAGLVIISGPPGSGKSSLIDAIVNINNKYLPGNIFIISDSIEYYHESKNSVVRHQELYRDVNSVVNGLEKCLHYKPNLVAIEDINSIEILEAIVKLVDTGCLVLATMKNRCAVEVIYKLISFYSSTEHGIVRKNLSRIISAIICVQLVPSGINKVFPVKEIMLNNEQLVSVISTGNIDEMYEIIQRGKKAGTYTMEQDLLHAVRAGKITTETALEYANNPHLIKNMLQFS